MAFLKKISSLEDKALYSVAVNLCQDNNFKKVALCLEKPIYDNSMHGSLSCEDLSKPLCTRDIQCWEGAVEEQCQRLTEGLPNSFKNGIHIWIYRIALEYLSYSRRQEMLLGVPRNFLLKFFSRTDWTGTGRLEEKELAKRLIKDEQLTTLQRYRIACMYCLYMDVSELWSILTQEERHSIYDNDNPSLSQEKNQFVLTWSYYLDKCQDELVTQLENFPWVYAAYGAVRYGNRAALMFYWKGLNEDEDNDIIIDLALLSLTKWKSVQNSYKWIKCLVTDGNFMPCKLSKSIEDLNLPNYYSELVYFFLSKMDERQQLTFFNRAFHIQITPQDIINDDSVIQCFLDWPLQDHFLSMMSLLWGIMPKDIYGECLLSLAKKYTGDYNQHYLDITSYCDRENNHYDYLNLLSNLWKGTPLEYKQHVFYNRKFSDSTCTRTVIERLICQFFKRCPVKEKEIALFKLIWIDLPQEEKIRNLHSVYGKTTCRILLREKMWSVVNWLLEKSLPYVEIASFKKDLIKSMHSECFWEIKEGGQKYVEDLIDWAYESDIEKTQFRYEIFNHKNFALELCSSLLHKGEFAKVESIINFCLPSDEVKRQFKDDVGRKTCLSLLNTCAWELMDKVLSWSLDAEDDIRNFKYDMFKNENLGLEYCSSFLVKGEIVKAEEMINFFLSSDEIKEQFKEDIGKRVYPSLLKKYAWKQMDEIFAWSFGAVEKVRAFKKNLFHCEGLDIHYELVFVQKQWENMEHFYKWFSLSPREIIKIKKKTIFMTRVIDDTFKALYEHKDKSVTEIIASLCWCITDEEMVTIFREKIEKQFVEKIGKCRMKTVKKRLDYLMRDIFSAIKVKNYL